MEIYLVNNYLVVEYNDGTIYSPRTYKMYDGNGNLVETLSKMVDSEGNTVEDTSYLYFGDTEPSYDNINFYVEYHLSSAVEGGTQNSQQVDSISQWCDESKFSTVYMRYFLRCNSEGFYLKLDTQKCS